MRFSPAFYRTAAVCSFLSVSSTLCLIFLPTWMAPAPDFAARMARAHDPVTAVRSWIYFLHPFVTFNAALGVALRLRSVASGLALGGVLGFGLWAITEAGQQAMTLVAFGRWRAAWLLGDAATRAGLEVQIGVYDGLWDALYLLLLVAFLIGNLLFACAMLRRAGLARVVGLFYIGAALLTLDILSGELGGPTTPAALGFWLYTLLQPLARLLIGVWLWRHADEARPLP